MGHGRENRAGVSGYARDMRRRTWMTGVVVAAMLGGCRSPTPAPPTHTAAATPEPITSPVRAEPGGHRVKALAITVLSTTQAPVGEGE